MVNTEFDNKRYEFSKGCIFKKRINNNNWSIFHDFSNFIHIIYDWQIVNFLKNVTKI